MPDISMCSNKNCPLKDKCYRFTAKPNERQAYSDFPGGEDCEYYWPDYSANDWKKKYKISKQ